MIEHSYKDILKKCPMPYLWGKRIIDTDGCIDYIIKGANEYLIKKLNLKKESDVINKSLEDAVGIKRCEVELFEKINEGIFERYQYVGNLKDIYKVTLNIDENNNFYMWFQIYHISSNYNFLLDDNLKAIIWIKDINGRYIKVNRNFEEFVGLKKSEIIGKKNKNLNIKNGFEHIQDYEKLILNSKEDAIERTIFEDNKWVSLFIYPMVDENKNVIGTYGFKIYDYVNSKTPIGIENRNKMLEIIVDNLTIPIFYKDAQGIYLYCNEAFSELVEMDRKQIIGKTDYDLDVNIKKERLDEYKKADYEVIQKKIINVDEELMKRSSGDRYIEVTRLPLWNYRKKVIGVIGIVIDLTQKKATERELEKLRLDFFSNLTHEFRTPLNLIFSSIQLIEQSLAKIEKGDMKLLKRYINIVDQNGMRLLKLVNNLIDSTRIDSGCVDYRPKNKDIVSFIENICDSVVEFSKSQGIELIFDTDQEEKIISFDGDQMERVILNLLSNAIKYNKKNGTIYVEINCENDYVDIRIKDTGVGIPNDKIYDVFEKFKQVDNRLTKISEGSGIGLYLVKSLVELHGGNISLKSTVGVGTQFSVKIPNKRLNIDNNDRFLYNESINMNKKIQIEFSDIY